MRGFHNGEYQDGEAAGRIFLCGQSGYGKTTEMRRLCEQCSGGAILYNHTGNEDLRRAIHVHQPGELSRVLCKVAGRSGWRIVYTPIGGDLHEHFRSVCRMAYITASVVLALDEVDFYCDARYGPSRMPPELYNLAHFGRHAPGAGIEGNGRRGVAMMFTARIPTSVARGLSSQASEFRLFHEDDPDYLDFYRRGVLRNRQDAERLRDLPKYKFYRVRKEDGQMVISGGARKTR
ncbi:MAG: hypothetical protein P4K78_10710 [Terracidiphilus sp.]|nr:hypothetical protein [Terracidiphilus sp.]